MRTMSDATEADLLLNAYVDGELDAASILAFERRLAAEPVLAAARDRLLALRGLLRESVPREAASERLRAAMAARAGAPTHLVSRSSGPGAALSRQWGRDASRSSGPWWMAVAACLLVGAFAGAGVTTLVRLPRAPDIETAEVLADHLRAVMAPQPFDVASSDQHTVKPWFTGRLPFAPQVFDLADAGFPLAGGRVDVVGGEPAAALVFRHGRHLVSLMSQPVPASAPEPPPRHAERGFAVREWDSGGMRYWAVSDVAAAELDAFETAFRARLEGAKD